MSTSVFKTPAHRADYIRAYEAALGEWPVLPAEFTVPTSFGSTCGVAVGAPDNPPLVLLHGNFASLTTWRHIIAPLSRDYRIYALDTIDDLGKSVPERLPQGRADYAVWLKEALLGLGLRRSVLVGHSYGGFLALNLALAEPEMVAKLVLLAPGVAFARPTRRWMWGMPMTVRPTPTTVRWFFTRATVKGFAEGDRELAQLMAGIPGLRSRVPHRPKFTPEELKTLRVPTLLLIGDQEILYPAEAAVRQAREWCPGLTAEIIGGAGHMLCHDQPGAVSERIVRFLTTG